MYTLRHIDRMDCDRKLLGGERDGQKEREAETERFSDECIVVEVIGHLRPSFYAHSFPPSPLHFQFVLFFVLFVVVVAYY